MEQTVKKKFGIRDIMTIAAMMVINFAIAMVIGMVTLPFPAVYLYGSAGIDAFIGATFYLVAANRINKHGLLFAWATVYGLIQGVMGYMFLVPYFLIVALIAELCMVGKNTYRNVVRNRIGWMVNSIGNFVGCAVPLWWSWDSYQEMAASSGFDANTLNMQLSMVTSPALMLLGVVITAVLAILGTLFGQRLLRRHCRMMAGEKKQRRIDRIDGRTVLFLTLCACLVTFLTTSFWGHGIFTFWIFLILCWFGLYKQAIGCFAVYLVAIVWLMIETKYQISIPSPLLLSMIYKLLLPAMPAYLLAKIPSGKLTASLRKMPIPTRIMLVLIVMLRFAPTVLHEFGEVREAMKIRGFLKSVGNVLRHPMDTLEYAIVPMVFRSLKIADELAASAIVRGIESPYKKESYYVSRIAALDYFLIVVSVGAAVCCCLL